MAPQIEINYLGGTWTIGGPVQPGGAAHDRVSVNLPTGTRVSSTAIGTALTRAAYTRCFPNPLIDDLWGDRLVPAFARQQYREQAAARIATQVSTMSAVNAQAALDQMLLSGAGFANIILRTRYAEDALRKAVARGIRQYVIIGAGFDSFAMRRPSFAGDVEVFEVDRVPTQALKRQGMEEAGLSVPESLHLVEADLGSEDLDAALARSGFRHDQATFFSWLGVTMFLTREANLATLGAIARCSAEGSEVVFTYFDQRIFDSGSERFEKLQKAALSVGEPIQSGFDPDLLADDLRSIGLERIEDLDEEQLVTQYLPYGNHAMVPIVHSRIALARVAPRELAG